MLPADAVLDDEGREWWDMVEGRIPDGGRLPAAIRARLAAGATPPIDPPEATVLRAWLSWAGGRFEQPASGPSTWSPEHMEYAFSVAGLGASGEALLTAPEYIEGRLEWYHFEQLQASGTLGVTGQPTVHRAFRIPAPLDFAGMPNPRFWTFEDRSVQFDLIDVLSNPDVEPSPATLMVLDFALSYSDDWFLLPIALDAWTIFDATDSGRDRRVRRRDARPASGRPLEPLSTGLERNTLHTLEPVRRRGAGRGHRRSAARGGALPRRRSGQRGVGRGAPGAACHSDTASTPPGHPRRRPPPRRRGWCGR